MNCQLLSQYILNFFTLEGRFDLINKYIKNNNVNQFNLYQFSNEIQYLLINWKTAESDSIKKMLKQITN